MIECADCGCYYDPDNERPENHSPACPVRYTRWEDDTVNPNIAINFRRQNNE